MRRRSRPPPIRDARRMRKMSLLCGIHRVSDMARWDAPPHAVGATPYVFPPPQEWPEGDAIVLGGQLDPATLVAAYRRGLFPMIAETSDPALVWWSPDPRAILPLDRLRVTPSL